MPTESPVRIQKSIEKSSSAPKSSSGAVVGSGTWTSLVPLKESAPSTVPGTGVGELRCAPSWKPARSAAVVPEVSSNGHQPAIPRGRSAQGTTAATGRRKISVSFWFGVVKGVPPAGGASNHIHRACEAIAGTRRKLPAALALSSPTAKLPSCVGAVPTQVPLVVAPPVPALAIAIWAST